MPHDAQRDAVKPAAADEDAEDRAIRAVLAAAGGAEEGRALEGGRICEGALEDAKVLGSADPCLKGVEGTESTVSDSCEPSCEPDGDEADSQQKRQRAPGEALRTALRGARDAFVDWMYPLARREAGQGGGSPRLEALDAMRWVASIQIVLYHMYSHKEGFSKYAGWCATWTQLFFLLSGFVLAYAEISKPPKTGAARPSLLRYIRRRMTVIYPAFFMSLLLKVTYAPGTSTFQWLIFPLHGLLLQSWLPLCHADSGHVSCSPWLFNGEAWFLSVLLLYWVGLRPLAELFRRRSLRFSAATLVACWLFSFVFQLLGDRNRLAQWLGCTSQVCPMTIMVAIRSGPLGYVHVFVAGVAAARVFLLTAMKDAETGERVGAGTRRVALAAERAPGLLRFGCCVGYTTYAVLLLAATNWVKTHYYFFHNGGMLPVMLTILLGAAIGVDPITTWIFRSKPMLVLGRISYMQYLMQHVLQGWVRRAFGWDDNHLAQVIFVPCLILFSYCCQRWVERPYTEYQRFRQEKGIKGFEDRAIEWVEHRALRAMP